MNFTKTVSVDEFMFDVRGSIDYQYGVICLEIFSVETQEDLKKVFEKGIDLDRIEKETMIELDNGAFLH